MSAIVFDTHSLANWSNMRNSVAERKRLDCKKYESCIGHRMELYLLELLTASTMDVDRRCHRLVIFGGAINFDERDQTLAFHRHFHSVSSPISLVDVKMSVIVIWWAPSHTDKSNRLSRWPSRHGRIFDGRLRCAKSWINAEKLKLNSSNFDGLHRDMEYRCLPSTDDVD